MRTLRTRLTYANVMATVAVMIALGGTGYAALSLPRGSVTSRAIRDGQVKTQDLANRAVTSQKLGNHSVTGAKVADRSLTGRAFKCGPGDAALGNRDFCAFKINGPFTWTEAVSACRARGSTPSTLATAADVAAFGPLGGSPFIGPAEFWTSSPASAGPNPRAYAVNTDAGGNVSFFASPLVTAQVASAACVYHAADVF